MVLGVVFGLGLGLGLIVLEFGIELFESVGAVGLVVFGFVFEGCEEGVVVVVVEVGVVVNVAVRGVVLGLGCCWGGHVGCSLSFVSFFLSLFRWLSSWLNSGEVVNLVYRDRGIGMQRGICISQYYYYVGTMEMYIGVTCENGTPKETSIFRIT